MSFLDNIKREYESPEDNLAKDFIVPALSECKVYKRETAWFKSSALRAWAESLKYIVDKKNIKIEILAYPKIDMTTFRSLKDTSSKEKKLNIIRAHREKILTKAIDFESKSEVHSRDVGKRIGELLSYLIAEGMLEIRFIQLGDEGYELLEDDNEDGLSHIKRGYFEFNDGTLVAFNGSANESHGGLMKQGEYMMVFDSRLDSGKERVADIKNKFDLTWEGKKPGVITEPISDKLLKRIKKFAPKSPPKLDDSDNDSQEVTAIKSSFDMPSYLWEHQKLAINKFLEEKKGILAMATGTGKTTTALEITRQLILRGEINKIIISATEKRALLYQWVDELYEWIDSLDNQNLAVYKTFDSYSQSLDFIGNNSLSAIVIRRSATDLGYVLENSDAKKTLIIQDEVHGFGAMGMRSIEGLHKKFQYTLGLSATPNRGYDENVIDEETQYIFDEIGPIIFKYDLEDAIKDKILCPFNYYPVKTELSDSDKKKYMRVRAAYEESKNTDTPWSEERLAIALADVKNNAENKPYDFSDFIQKNPKLVRNTIIFCSTWAQADNISRELIKISKNYIRLDAINKDDQIKAIANFGESSDCIITCHALSEGVDIKGLENIFLIASYRKPIETIQRIGRCIRSDKDNPNKIANVVDFIVYRSIEDDDIISADKDRQNWITKISEVRPNE
jgi:superfamily II DNA or RNA helicase